MCVLPLNKYLKVGQEFWGCSCGGATLAANPRGSSAYCSFSDALIRFSRDHLRGDAVAPHYVPYLLSAFNHQSALRYHTFPNTLLSSFKVWMPPTPEPLWAHKDGVLILALLIISCITRYLSLFLLVLFG